MSVFLFKPTTVINSASWWIDRNYIKDIEIKADKLDEALILFAEYSKEQCYVSISDHALKNKEVQYQDIKDKAIQTGYVIKGSTFFYNEQTNIKVRKYIDIWVTIKEVSNPFN